MPPYSLHSLDLSGNVLGELPPALQSATLKKLAVGGNLLGCFPAGFFREMPALLFLDASANLLSEDCLDGGALQGCRHILF